jgi:hypothetical protein
MREFQASEAKTHLPKLLDDVEAWGDDCPRRRARDADPDELTGAMSD